MADFYQYHLFFCTHKRDDGSACCQQHGAQAMRDYAKQRVKELNSLRFESIMPVA